MRDPAERCKRLGRSRWNVHQAAEAAVPDLGSSDRDPKRNPDNGPTPRLLGIGRQISLRERLIARDEQALAELIDTASPWLLNVAQAMLQDHDEAEEVVMDTFRIVWQNVAPEGEGNLGLMPYLLRVTRHRAIDRLRSRRRRERKLSAATSYAGTREVPTTELDEAGRPGWHVHTQVHSALSGLPPDQRAVVRLAYFEGLTQSEIAAELSIPLGTVKTRLRLAFGNLRTVLAGLRDWLL
jgi:RNA polymerase sigma-70 factor, ECF subfamily